MSRRLSLATVLACAVLVSPSIVEGPICTTDPLCHGGLALSCAYAEPGVCTTDIQPGEVCRQYANCVDVGQGCQMDSDAQIAVDRCSHFMKACQNSMPFDECDNWGSSVTVDFNDDVIPESCVSWFDGCNTCSVENGLPALCTEMYCPIMGGRPGCVEHSASDTDCPAVQPVEGDQCNNEGVTCEYGNLPCCDNNIAVSSCQCTVDGWSCRQNECDPPTQQCQLASAKRNWHACQHQCYSYDLDVLCFCLPEFTIDKHVVVNGDEVTVTFLNGTQASPGTYPSFGLTIPDLFIYVQSLMDDSGAANDITYDETCGFPLKIDADPIPLAIDDEMGVRVSNFMSQQCQQDDPEVCCDPDDKRNCPHGDTCCSNGHWRCNAGNGISRCEEEGVECVCCPAEDMPTCQYGATCCSHGRWSCNTIGGSTCVEDGEECPVDDVSGCPETDNYSNLSGESCSLSAGTCYYGEETCCGETHPSFFCSCFSSGPGSNDDLGQFACGYTDACLRPPGSCGQGSGAGCNDANCNVGESCVEAHDGTVACHPSCGGGYCGNFQCSMQQTECKTEPCYDVPVCDCNVACIDVYDPVTGCDGVTYSNSCQMSVAQCNNMMVNIVPPCDLAIIDT